MPDPGKNHDKAVEREDPKPAEHDKPRQDGKSNPGDQPGAEGERTAGAEEDTYD